MRIIKDEIKMKKIYMTPHLEILAVVNSEQLCDGGGLYGWSATNESDGSSDGGGSSDNDGDPEWGTAGAKHFDCWNSWDD